MILFLAQQTFSGVTYIDCIKKFKSNHKIEFCNSQFCVDIAQFWK